MTFRLCLLSSALVLVLAGCSSGPSTSTGDSVGISSDAPTEDARAQAPTLHASPAHPPAADEYAEVGRHSAEAGRMVFDLTNGARTEQGRATLSRDSTLARIACWHNQDMLTHEYLGHEDADGRSPGERVAREHRRLIGSAGENVFERSGHSASVGQIEADEWAASIMEGWMKSEGHRANILRQKFTHLGACVTYTQSEGRATQMFAAVWAYLDEPMPWFVSAADSLSVDITPIKAAGPPAEYAFVPVGEPLGQAFSQDARGRPFDGTLHFPEDPGTYGSRFLFPEGQGRYTVLSGPRVSVE
jgi:uncharacterized protein YkwD